ncbi:hypothetical protein LX32DRAFT_292252 [Colletotrichum zoysiae]|uniref:Uncharacterized protein n=1 Tax=Colletotrichum zoysiae TaxID=1216348 RepID=A0AAD9LTM4_9PEZI|nr:hypothetical protein LX32DRAFT_292252 [Colletotrichum zoysiae]
MNAVACRTSSHLPAKTEKQTKPRIPKTKWCLRGREKMRTRQLEVEGISSMLALHPTRPMQNPMPALCRFRVEKKKEFSDEEKMEEKERPNPLMRKHAMSTRFQNVEQDRRRRRGGGKGRGRGVVDNVVY